MTLPEYYTGVLYPLQDKVLDIFRSCDLPFFLTGGTAISRGYYGHRYSDDLDFFVNHDRDFANHSRFAISKLAQAGFEVEILSPSPDFTRVFVDRNRNGLGNNGLKIDLVNDISIHFGQIQNTPVYYRTDSMRNILSNKYTAAYRIDPKDAVDLVEISRHEKFNWHEIFNEAEQKEGGIDPSEIADIFRSFSENDFLKIKWTCLPDIKKLREHVLIMTNDLLEMKENSLSDFYEKEQIKKLKNNSVTATPYLTSKRIREIEAESKQKPSTERDKSKAYDNKHTSIGDD